MALELLVAKVRQELLNARANGYEMLELHDDESLANDMQDCVWEFDNLDRVELVEAIAQVRKEGL